MQCTCKCFSPVVLLPPLQARRYAPLMPNFQVTCMLPQHICFCGEVNRRTPREKGFPPLARATCTPYKWHPQWILSWYGMRATCEFGIGGATRVPLRAAREGCVQNTCTCTARELCTLAPFFIRRQVGLAKVHPCTEFRVGVASSKFTLTGGPHVRTSSSPLARAVGCIVSLESRGAHDITWR